MVRRNLKQEFSGGWTSVKELAELRGKSVSTIRRRLKALEAEHDEKLIRQTAGGGKWEVHLGRLERVDPDLFRHDTTRIERKIKSLQDAVDKAVSHYEMEWDDVNDQMGQHRKDLEQLIVAAEQRLNCRLSEFEKSVRSELSSLSEKVSKLDALSRQGRGPHANQTASDCSKTSTYSKGDTIDDVHS